MLFPVIKCFMTVYYYIKYSIGVGGENRQIKTKAVKNSTDLILITGICLMFLTIIIMVNKFYYI